MPPEEHNNASWGSFIDEFTKIDLKELLKDVVHLSEDKESEIKTFMTQCFNLTTNFTKCDCCEFRFKCYTEVKKRGK